MNRTRLLAATLAATTALVAWPASADAASGRARPTDVAGAQTEIVPNGMQVYNDYASPERTYSTRYAVVHYVVLGIDAPPLNDDNGNGVPDYVEQVGQAADSAIGYYHRRGFRSIRDDTGGPDARPDLYISRFTPGTFGISFPASEAEGGAFAVIANGLDPSGTLSLASLDGTVAHELFHLVQFSYFAAGADPALPPWTLEGTAAAMEARVYPELDDIVAWIQTRDWYLHPDRPITTQSYGAQDLWRWLDVRYPGLLPAFLARLAEHPSGGNARRAFAATFARQTGTQFAGAFEQFAVGVADDHPSRITPHATLRPRASCYAAAVAPFAIHYLRLPLDARTVTVAFRGAEREAALTYQLASDVAGNAPATRTIEPRASAEGSLSFRVPDSVRRSGGRASALTLTIANGQPAAPLRYRVTVR